MTIIKDIDILRARKFIKAHPAMAQAIHTAMTQQEAAQTAATGTAQATTADDTTADTPAVKRKGKANGAKSTTAAATDK